MKTHPLNVSYLVVGLAFLGLAGSWALRAAAVIDTGDIGWLAPLVLVVAGLVGLGAFAVRGVSRGRSVRPVPAAEGDAPGADPAFDQPFDDDASIIDTSTDPGDPAPTAGPTTHPSEDTTVLPTHEENR